MTGALRIPAPPRPHLTLREWQTRGPDDDQVLLGRSFDDDPAARRLAADLTRSRRLGVTELRRGLSITTSSWVGRVRLGALDLTILPKIEGAPFLTLLRYGFGLRELSLVNLIDTVTTADAWPDLLIAQLAAEAAELLESGLHRSYLRRAEDLASPRGRIDIDTLARRGPAAQTLATLPCVHHPRSEDVLLNRVVRAGLELGARLTADRTLAIALRRLASRFGDAVTPVRLDATTLAAADRATSRLTDRYTPLLDLIRLLTEAHGLDDLTATGPDRTLPGFLFDMNRLFQAVLTRFLSEHLPDDYRVESEHRLSGVFRYAPGLNPRNRSAPTPRPDLAIRRRNHVVAFLDVKYRDLWETPLPRDMLYQLAIYALSHGQREATILYPTTSPLARESAVDVLDPAERVARARVRLRPIQLLDLADHVERVTRVGATRFAQSLAFGDAPL
ncbi:MAG: McrC family protein [Planctomycetes bacterium]|nr:McrC family protein [Planctomycetota bacterium]